MTLYMDSLEDRGMNQKHDKTTQNMATLQLVTLQLLLQNFPGALFLIYPGGRHVLHSYGLLPLLVGSVSGARTAAPLLL